VVSYLKPSRTDRKSSIVNPQPPSSPLALLARHPLGGIPTSWFPVPPICRRTLRPFSLTFPQNYVKIPPSLPPSGAAGSRLARRPFGGYGGLEWTFQIEWRHVLTQNSTIHARIEPQASKIGLFMAYKALDKCRESSTNSPFFVQTNPIPKTPKITATLFPTKAYNKTTPFGKTQKRTQTNPNEPKTNPIFRSSGALKAKTNPNEPKANPIFRPSGAPKAKTNPIKPKRTQSPIILVSLNCLCIISYSVMVT